jgi:hypothetical protein
MSIPTSDMTSIAKGLTSADSVPALSGMNRLPAKTRTNPSAICARDAFPLDKNKILGVLSTYNLPSASDECRDSIRPSSRGANLPERTELDSVTPVTLL